MQHENIHITTDILINAPQEKVWEVLSALEQWPTWTTLILSIEGTFQKDAALTLTFVNPEGGRVTFDRKMFLFEEGQAFGWTGAAFAGLSDFHVFELETVADGVTRLTQSDGLHGADVPGVAAMEAQMKMGYQLFNQELKTYIENLS